MAEIELTKDTINSVLLEMSSNETLFNDKIENVLNFLLDNYKNVNELLSKLKVLNISSKESKKIDTESTTMDQLLLNYSVIRKLDIKNLTENIVAIARENSQISRKILILYFKEAKLESDKATEILYKLSELIMEITKSTNEYLKYKSDFSENSDDNLDKVCEIKSTIVTLTEDEVRMIVKILDSLDLLAKNSYFDNTDFFPILLSTLTSGKPYIKRTPNLIRALLSKVDNDNKQDICDTFFYFLQNGSNVIRITDFISKNCSDVFDWNIFFDILDSNPEANLTLLNRSIVPFKDFIIFLGRAKTLGRYLNFAKSVIFGEKDIEKLIEADLVIETRIVDNEDAVTIKRFIFTQIKRIDLGLDPKNVIKNRKRKIVKQKKMNANE